MGLPTVNMPDFGQVSTVEILFLLFWLFVIFSFALVAYRITGKDYENFNTTIILLIISFIGLIFSPDALNFYIVIFYWILILNLVLGIVLQKFSHYEIDKILIDRVPQVWDTFNIPPETKDAWRRE